MYLYAVKLEQYYIFCNQFYFLFYKFAVYD